MRKDKRGIELEVLAWWIIGILVFVLLLVGYLILKNKGMGGIDFIKNLFRFGGK